MSVEPGATTLQRMPNFETSRPRHLVNMVAAALEAAYADMSTRAVPAALDATVTIAPRRPAATIRLTTAREMKKTPVVFTAKVADQSWSVRSLAAPSRSTPAPLTR